MKRNRRNSTETTTHFKRCNLICINELNETFVGTHYGISFLCLYVWFISVYSIHHFIHSKRFWWNDKVWGCSCSSVYNTCKSYYTFYIYIENINLRYMVRSIKLELRFIFYFIIARLLYIWRHSQIHTIPK